MWLKMNNVIFQGWPDFFSQGPKLKIVFMVRASKFEHLLSSKILRLFVPFLIIFWCLLREKSDIFWNFSINLIFCNAFFQMKKGLRAAKTSWRATLWPPLLYSIPFSLFRINHVKNFYLCRLHQLNIHIMPIFFINVSVMQLRQIIELKFDD